MRYKQWNSAKARLLYDKDLSYAAIALACDTTRMTVIKHAKRHWPRRPIDAERSARYFKPSNGKPKPPKHNRGKSTLAPLDSLQDK